MRFKGCILGVCLVFSGNGAAISAPSTPPRLKCIAGCHATPLCFGCAIRLGLDRTLRVI